MRPAAAALALLLAAGPAFAAPPPELAEVWAGDCPGDEGGVIAVRWRTKGDDPSGRFWRVKVKPLSFEGEENWPKPGGLSTDYTKDQLLLRDVKRPFWALLGENPKGDAHWAEVDLALHFPPKEGRTLEQVLHGKYRVQLAWQDEGRPPLRDIGPAFIVQAEPNLWNAKQANHLALTVLLCALILLGARSAKAKPPPAPFGESGRAFLLPGVHSFTDLSTLSALSALKGLGRRMGSRLSVLNANGVVLAASRALAPDSVHAFLPEERWAYAAGAAGRMRREKPESVLFLGYFYAEALLLAETAAEAGARQVGGTDNELQMPFLDGTEPLFGEDLYAAEARLSGRPEAARILSGQDRARILLLLLLLAGALGLLHPDLLRPW